MEEKNKCAHTGFIGGCCLPGEEKMREIREKWAAFAMRNGTDLNLDFRVTSDWWLAQLKQSHLALLEQMIGENERRKHDEMSCNCNSENECKWNEALDLINTNLRTKIEELKKQV